jgi:hypothetical protein
MKFLGFGQPEECARADLPAERGQRRVVGLRRREFRHERLGVLALL